MLSINLKRSVVTLAVIAGLLAAAGPANADSTKYTMLSPDRVASSEVFELNIGVQSREPARTITMLDYEGNPVLDSNAATDDLSLRVAGAGNGIALSPQAPGSDGVAILDYEGTPVVTYLLKHSSRGDDRFGATGLKSDSNEVAVEGLTLVREPQRLRVDLVEELGADS